MRRPAVPELPRRRRQSQPSCFELLLMNSSFNEGTLDVLDDSRYDDTWIAS